MTHPPSFTKIQKLANENGIDFVGVARSELFASTLNDLQERKGKNLHGGMEFTYRNPKRSTNPNATMPDAESLIVAAQSYWQPISHGDKTTEPMGRVALYAQRDHYAYLKKGLQVIAEELNSKGFKTRILVDDNALVDREAAFRAGIGWYGKNANILIPKRGSWFILGSILTDAPFQPNEPIEDGCGTCTKCIPACPTDAITEPGVIDANRCLAWLVQAEGQFPTEFRIALGDRIYGCDDCQLACPANKFEERLYESRKSSSSRNSVSIHEILEADDQQLLSEFGQWYIPKRDPRYLRRNALIVLGNSQLPPTARTIRAVERWLSDSDEMLRSHAVWTAKRLGLYNLLTGLGNDSSQAVQKELSMEVPRIHPEERSQDELVWTG